MLKLRGKKWYAVGYYWDRKLNRRARYRESTGIVDDGTARTKRIAEQLAADVGQRYALGGIRPARALTLETAIKIHDAAHTLAGSSAVTLEIVGFKAARLFEFFGPDYDCNALTDPALVEYANHRRLMPGRKKGSFVTSGTIHRELRTLREALGDAKTAGKFDGAIPNMPDLGTVYRPQETWIDKPQSQRLLMALPVQYRDHFIMYRQLGLDRGELYRITPPDIDWNKGELRVRGTKTEARDRVIPLTRETLAILLARKDAEPMFKNWGNNALRDLAKACMKAGVPRVNVKDLRRSFCTDLAIAGKSPLLVMHLMGHTSTRMIEKVYARVGRGEHMHAVMEAVSEMRPDTASWVNTVPDTAKVAGTADNDSGA